MMRVVENKGQNDDLGQLAGSSLSVSASSLIARDVYHELAESGIQQHPDLIDQLNSNIDRISDLQTRMNFMVRELRTLMKV